MSRRNRSWDSEPLPPAHLLTQSVTLFVRDQLAAPEGVTHILTVGAGLYEVIRECQQAGTNAEDRERCPLPVIRTPPIGVKLGEIVITDKAENAFVEARVSPIPYLLRHKHGDWGDVCPEDARRNDEDAGAGGAIYSVYRLPTTGVTVWIITPVCRTRTTVLLPSEY